jgi:hypothetical protein
LALDDGYVFRLPQMDMLANLVAIWEQSYGDQIYLNRSMVTKFGRGFFKVYEFSNAIHDLFFNTLFSFGFCVFGCPLITIVWNLGRVELIKSLVKGYLFYILQMF